MTRAARYRRSEWLPLATRRAPARLLAANLLAVLVGVVLVGPQSASSAMSAELGSAPPVHYSDPPGDSAGADITDISVWNDYAGNITFRAEIPNRPIAEANFVLLLFIDVDRNDATGEPGTQGIDYILGYHSNLQALSRPPAIVSRWNGTAWDQITLWDSTVSYDAGVTFSVRVESLPGIQSFEFFAAAADNGDAPRPDDYAPDGTTWIAYEIAKKPEIVEIRAPSQFPAIRAGKIFRARGLNVALDNGEIASPDALRCALKIAGKRIRTITRCTWRIPRDSAGERLTLSVWLTYDGEVVKKNYVGRVAAN